MQCDALKTTNICAPAYRISAEPKIGRSSSHQKTSTRSSTQLLKNTSHKSWRKKTTWPADASEYPNAVTGSETRTKATSCSAFNSTTPESNGTQRENVVTGSSQHDAPQEAQPATPQANDDNGDYGNSNNNVLPRNLDANDFGNVAN